MTRFHATEWDFYPEDAFQPCAGRMRMHGGKGSSAPPPDPRLTAAQIESSSTQSDISRQMLAQSQELMPLQRQTLQFGLDASKTAYAQSQEDRNYALGKRAQLDAAQQPLINEALNFDEASRRSQLMGESDQAISANFAGAKDQQQRGLNRTGTTVTAEQEAAMGSASSMAEAKARTTAGHAVSGAAKQEGMQARSNAVNMLGGYAPMASGLATTGAQLGSQAVGAVNAGVTGLNSGLSAANQIFGQMGTQATGLWNTQASAKYTADKAANDSNSEMWGSVIGAVAMVAMSDERLKTDIKRVGRNPKNGLSIYTFKYKGSPFTHKGYMASEVEQVAPHAVKIINGYKAVDYAALL